MKLGKVSFTESGFNDFQKLTKKQQIEKLNKLMPLEPNVERLLKGVKYGKHSRNKKTFRKSTEKDNS